MTQPTSGGPASDANKDREDTYNYIGWRDLTEAARESHYFVGDMRKADRTSAIIAHLQSMEDLPCEPYIIACTIYSRENAIKVAKYTRQRATKAGFSLMWWSCARYPSSTNVALNLGKGNKLHRMVIAFRTFGLQDLVGITREPIAAYTMQVEIKLPGEQVTPKTKIRMLGKQATREVNIKIGTPNVRWAQSFTEPDLVEVLEPFVGDEHKLTDLPEATEGMLKVMMKTPKIRDATSLSKDTEK